MASLGRTPVVREILLAPHPTLARVARKLTEAELRDPLARQLAEDMFATVAARNLIGMAAPQIGVSRRFFVVDFVREDRAYGPLALANPRIVARTGEVLSTEGSPCVPGATATVRRAAEIVCRGVDLDGRTRTVEASGLFAICIQHEIDHLDGILCFDRERADAAEDRDASEAAPEASGR